MPSKLPSSVTPLPALSFLPASLCACDFGLHPFARLRFFFFFFFFFVLLVASCPAVSLCASDLLGRVKVPVAEELRHARLRNSGPLGGTAAAVKGKRSGKSTLLLSFEFTRLGGAGGGEECGVDKA